RHGRQLLDAAGRACPLRRRVPAAGSRLGRSRAARRAGAGPLGRSGGRPGAGGGARHRGGGPPAGGRRALRSRVTVLVTRPAQEAQRWVQQLRAAGIAAEALPLLAIGPAADPTALAAARATLGRYAAVMFV